MQNHTIIQHQKPCLYSISWTLPAELQQHLVGHPAPQQTTKPTKTEKYRYNIFSSTVQKIFAFFTSQLQRNYNVRIHNSKMMEIDPINKLKKLSKSPCTFTSSIYLFYYPASARSIIITISV